MAQCKQFSYQVVPNSRPNERALNTVHPSPWNLSREELSFHFIGRLHYRRSRPGEVQGDGLSLSKTFSEKQQLEAVAECRSVRLLPLPSLHHFHRFAVRVIILSCRFHNILRSRRFLRSTPSPLVATIHPPLPGHQRRHSRSIKVMKTPRTFQPSRVTLRAPKGFPSKEFIPRRGLLNSKQTQDRPTDHPLLLPLSHFPWPRVSFALSTVSSSSSL